MRPFFYTLLLLITGSIVTCQSVSGIRAAGKSSDWAKTSGLVHSVGVKSEHAGRAGTVHRPSVLYGYTLNEVGYSNDRVDFARDTMSRSAAMKQASRFTIGQTVTVRYDPKDPEQSALEVGVVPMDWIKLGGGMLMIALAVFFAKRLWKNLTSGGLAPASGF